MNVQDYTSSVWDIINDLKKWKDEAKSPFFFSEIVDDDDNQYVNLIQEGGGMLGIALAGFTYVLEEMGLRFLGLGGTSAGSINAFLLAALGTPHEKKSERIIKYLTQKKFLDFMDGGKDAKAFVKSLGAKSNISFKKYNPLLLWNAVDLVKKQGMNPGLNFERWLDEILIRSKIELRLLRNNIYEDTLTEKLWHEDELVSFIASVVSELHAIDEHGSKILDLSEKQKAALARIKIAHTVESSGKFESEKSRELTVDELVDFIVDTIHKIEDRAGLHLVGMLSKDLIDQKKVLPLLYIKRYSEDDDSYKKQTQGWEREIINQYNTLALIAAELTTQTKVIFPDMAHLYYENWENTNPTKFVRASMSVPVLFEPVRIPMDWIDPNDKKQYQAVRSAWVENCQFKGELPDEVMLVDGGIMSNFPIDVFDELADKSQLKDNETYTPQKLKPTTIGVKLGVDRKTAKKANGIFSLVGLCFDNARNVRDFEYIQKNPEFSDEAIAYINTDDFNWLNFDMPEKEMKALFRKGAEEAARFLKSYSFGRYKKSINGKVKKITLNQLVTAYHDYPYHDDIYNADYPISDKKNKLYIKKFELPEDVQGFWPNDKKEGELIFNRENNIAELETKPIPVSAYYELKNDVSKIDEINNGLKNLSMRFTLMRNMFRTSELEKGIGRFGVLWLTERIDNHNVDPNDKAVMDSIKYAGGWIDEVKMEDELRKVINDRMNYAVVVMRTMPKDLNRHVTPLLARYREATEPAQKVEAALEAPNESIEAAPVSKKPDTLNKPKIISFVPNAKDVWCDANQVRVYNTRLDLLHKIVDVYHRNIY